MANYLTDWTPIGSGYSVKWPQRSPIRLQAHTHTNTLSPEVPKEKNPQGPFPFKDYILPSQPSIQAMRGGVYVCV